MLKLIERFTLADAKRFWTKVAVGANDACWQWRAGVDKDGYGRFKVGGRETGTRVLAHRIAFTLAHGSDLADGLVVRHTCDNRACCNPAHLLTGTHQDNMADMVARGRAKTTFGRAKLDWDLVDHIRASPMSGVALSEALGISKSVISEIRSGKIWKTEMRDRAIVPQRAAA